jgi:hypothetical protein
MSLQPATHFESSPYLFNARELARLAVYRAAIVARFYTDQLDQPTLGAGRQWSDGLGRGEASRTRVPRQAQ